MIEGVRRLFRKVRFPPPPTDPAEVRQPALDALKRESAAAIRAQRAVTLAFRSIERGR